MMVGMSSEEDECAWITLEAATRNIVVLLHLKAGNAASVQHVDRSCNIVHELKEVSHADTPVPGAELNAR